MNRFNFGNQITNGMQILSVSVTKARGLFKGRADSTLNNRRTKTNPQKDTTEMDEKKAENLDARTANVNARTENIQARTNNINSRTELQNKKILKEFDRINRVKKPYSVDEIMAENSDQIPAIREKVDNDLNWISQRRVVDGVEYKFERNTDTGETRPIGGK